MTDPPVGARVRLIAPTWGLTIVGEGTGTVVREADDLGYLVVRLDDPALYDHGVGGPLISMTEVAEMADNLEILL